MDYPILPSDIWIVLAKHIPLRDRHAHRLVCKQWYKLMSVPRHIRHIVYHIPDPPCDPYTLAGPVLRTIHSDQHTDHSLAITLMMATGNPARLTGYDDLEHIPCYDICPYIKRDLRVETTPRSDDTTVGVYVIDRISDYVHIASLVPQGSCTIYSDTLAIVTLEFRPTLVSEWSVGVGKRHYITYLAYMPGKRYPYIFPIVCVHFPSIRVYSKQPVFAYGGYLLINQRHTLDQANIFHTGIDGIAYRHYMCGRVPVSGTKNHDDLYMYMTSMYNWGCRSEYKRRKRAYLTNIVGTLVTTLPRGLQHKLYQYIKYNARLC